MYIVLFEITGIVYICCTCTRCIVSIIFSLSPRTWLAVSVWRVHLDLHHNRPRPLLLQYPPATPLTTPHTTPPTTPLTATTVPYHPTTPVRDSRLSRAARPRWSQLRRRSVRRRQLFCQRWAGMTPATPTNRHLDPEPACGKVT